MNTKPRWSLRWLQLSLCLAVIVLVAYRWQPDGLAFATILPVWCWWLPGLFCALVGWRRASRRGRITLAGVWLFVALFTADTPTALLRPQPTSSTQTPVVSAPWQSLRVVSFNTGGGRPPRSWQELVDCFPDIVLIQETYSAVQVEHLSQALFGNEAGWHQGPDCAILARGKVTPLTGVDPVKEPCVVASVEIKGYPAIHAVSLRLAPQTVRFDLWSPDCWKTFAEFRRTHRRQLLAITNRCEQIPSDAPIIFGGDFNAPAGDGIFRLLQPRFVDAFAQVGCGWGCTMTNDYPLLRIDQIWATPSLRPLAAWSQRSVNSDHRLVIAEFATPSEMPRGAEAPHPVPAD